MTEWNEDTLRSAASWMAFKDGKSLLGIGAVTEAKSGSTGWQGTVRAGKRMLRVSVKVNSATDLETRCGCAENQRTGELCAHAVAVGLAAMAGATHEADASPAKIAAVPSSGPAVAWEVVLPENWRQALVRGKLSAGLTTLSREPDAEISPSDERLSAWVQREAGTSKPQLALHIDGPRLITFLEAILDHPRVKAGSKGGPIEISAGLRLVLGAAERAGDDEVQLVPAASTAGWTFVAGSFWRLEPTSLSRMGSREVPQDLRPLIALLADSQPVLVPVTTFLSRLESWQEWLEFPPESWVDSLHFVPASPQFLLTLEGGLQRVEATLRVDYGGPSPVPPGEGNVPNLPRLENDVCHIRNLAAEHQAVQRLERAGMKKAGDSSGSWMLAGEAAVTDFVARVLPGLSGWTVREIGKPLTQQIIVVRPQIQILGSGEDWLSFDLKFQTTDGSAVSTEEVRRLLRSGKTVGKGSGGRRVVIGEELGSMIDPLFEEIDLRQEDGHFVTNARSGELIRELREKLTKSQDLSKPRKIAPFAPSPSMTVNLRPYQAEGAGWLLDRVERFGGALLADDMGLGKTVQTIALIEKLLAVPEPLDPADSRVVLVVATATLLGNWKAEWGRFAPGRQVRILHGSGREAEQKRVEPGDVVLTSYGTLGRDLAWHLKRVYRAVVVDEASLMRNPDTDHAKAVSKLKSARRVALTGTPVENGVRDLWSIFRFIQPGWLGGREEFRERYEQPLANEGSGAVMERLRLKASPFLLRRTKEQVAPELPSKIMIDEFCELTADQQGVYKELLKEGRKRVEMLGDSGNSGAARMQMLTALLRLRQTCNDLALLGNDRWKHLPVTRRSAKLQRLLELLEEAIAGGHRVLVFSQFQTQLREIEKCVIERQWESLRLDGQSRNRQDLVDRFQKADGPPVFLISLKAGGYGLNLTAADTVVHFDPWWNPAAEAQATDRAHRIGQSRPVTVYRLLARGTVEEKVVSLQAKKRELAAAIDESGMGDGAGWSTEEIAAVLQG